MPSGKKRKRHKVATHKRKKEVAQTDIKRKRKLQCRIAQHGL
jgi:hypothetical protein